VPIVLDEAAQAETSLLLLAMRLRSAVYSAKFGTTFEHEMAEVEKNGFLTPMEREMWKTIGKGIIAAVDACLSHPASVIH